MRVVGTAGHVDHGKSTLVRALTGTDPDRLREEKARGMTIDLGFAWTALPSPEPLGGELPIGLVDVPGHIDFIKNMLAGVGGIDAALLVIAADEGVMPQTREHLAVLDLLQVPAAVVALSKVDLLDDPEWLELVEADVADLLAATHLAGAPIVRISATTGQGLDALRAALARALLALPPRLDRARPRLPIDRLFSLPGFGVVVTGTLLDGALQVGDAVEILPRRLNARVRGLQTHGRALQVAEPGSRVAINLAGVDLGDLHRGDVAAHPQAFEPTRLIDAEYRQLGTIVGPLQHNAPVEFFCGAAETQARVRVIGAEAIAPGETGRIQLRLERPVAVAAQDRFILRNASPSLTLGGGRILAPNPPRRWRRFDVGTLARFETLQRGDPRELLLEAIGRGPASTAQELAGALHLPPGEAEAGLAELREAGAVRAFTAGATTIYLTHGAWRDLCATLTGVLGAFHTEKPLRAGMPRNEARNRVAAALRSESLSARHFTALIERAAADGILAADEVSVRLAGFAPTPTTTQRAAMERTLAAFGAAPEAPPNLPETLALLNGDDSLFEWMTAEGRLIRLGNDVLFEGGHFLHLTERVVALLQERGALTLGEARDQLGMSRKYVQALLEEMDARRITRRDGDARVLRDGQAPSAQTPQPESRAGANHGNLLSR